MFETREINAADSNASKGSGEKMLSEVWSHNWNAPAMQRTSFKLADATTTENAEHSDQSATHSKAAEWTSKLLSAAEVRVRPNTIYGLTLGEDIGALVGAASGFVLSLGGTLAYAWITKDPRSENVFKGTYPLAMLAGIYVGAKIGGRIEERNEARHAMNYYKLKNAVNWEDRGMASLRPSPQPFEHIA